MITVESNCSLPDSTPTLIKTGRFKSHYRLTPCGYNYSNMIDITCVVTHVPINVSYIHNDQQVVFS